MVNEILEYLLNRIIYLKKKGRWNEAKELTKLFQAIEKDF